MPKVKISEFSSTPANNTDIDSIFIGEGMAPSNVNDAIRELMSQLKDWQSGTSNDPYVIGSSGSLTLNQGTANTIPYLNGSKVVTSGTALTFDGTNLGLGVTPSAWSGIKAMQIGTAASFNGGSGFNDAFIASNAFYDGSNWKYINSNPAYYSSIGGSASARWYTAPSGTAGNAITFTQAMTLDASGNLIVAGTAATNTSSGRGNITINGSSSAILSMGTGGTAKGYVYHSGSDMIVNATTGTLALQANGNGAVIDSSGNLLVGTTSGSTTIFKRNVDNASASVRVISACATTSNQFGISCELNGDPNNTTNYLFAGRGGVDGITDRAVIRSNGGLANYSANNVNLSDRREKTNFAPAKSYLDVICAIPVQTYNYIDQNMEEDGGLTLGVVAQDVQEVAPELVTESNWGTQEAPKMRLSIYQTDMQYALMKCIQEQQAIIESLKARLDAANL